MKNNAVIAVLILLIGVTWGRVTAAEEVTQLAQFSIFPESILLAEGEQRDTTWVIHNPNKKELSIENISPLSAEGVEISLPSRQSDGTALVIGGLSDLALVVKIRSTGEIRGEQKVYLRLDYLIDGAKRTALDCMTVSPRTALPVEKIVSLSVESKLESINEHRIGWVYLVVTNKSNQPIQIGPAKMLAPDFVRTSAELAESSILTGQDAKTIPIEIRVTNNVQPGSHLLVFDLAVTQIQNGKEQIYHLTQQYPVTVGIIGESEILKILQIPSFLVLPGVLSVLTVGFLWGLFREPSKKEKFPLTYKNENFWLVAITLSIGIAFVYPSLTQWFLKERRDYLYGYGVKDVVGVWLLGIGMGLVACILFTVSRKLFRLAAMWRTRAKERQLRRDYPTPRDTPLDLLSKLHRQGLALGLERVRLKDKQVLFLLQKRTDDATKYWLSSEIEITLPDGLDTEIDRAINQQLVPQGSPEILLQQLEKGRVEILPQTVPPVQIPASDIQDTLGVQVFVSIV